MSFIKAVGKIVGGVALGTGGLVLGATLGWGGIGPLVAIVSIMGAIVLVDSGVQSW